MSVRQGHRHRGCFSNPRTTGHVAGIVILVVTSAAIGQVAGRSSAPIIEPDPRLQALFRDIATDSAKLFDPAIRDQMVSGRTRAVETEEGDAEQGVIQQLVYFGAYATGLREAVAARAILQYGGFDVDDIVPALVPYLDTPDEKVAKTVREWLHGFEFGCADPDERPCFDVYTAQVDDAIFDGRNPPRALVRYLYERHAGAAMLFLFRVAIEGELQTAILSNPDATSLPGPGPLAKQRKPVLFAEHIVEDVLWRQRHEFPVPESLLQQARDALQRLSGIEHWSTRLYVAEIMRQHPVFRDEKLIKRLAQDTNPYVRESIAMFWRAKSGG